MPLNSSKILTHGELFAGISGFGLGFAKAGIETIWHVEIDKYCQKVLRHHYPDTLLLADVRDCGKHNLPYADIISFGTPCQDLSVAGKRKGLKGKRSGLFFEAIRIVDELKPTFAVWENVPGAFSSNSGRDFASVLSAFQKCGARDIAWRVLDAQYFGVPQRRRRVFLIADFREERAAEVLFERESSPWDTAPGRKERQKVANPLGAKSSGHRNDLDNDTFVFNWQSGGDVRLGISKQVTDALHSSQTKLRGQPNQGPGRMADDSARAGLVRRLTPKECERLQGFPDDFTAIDGMSDSARYRMLGNAVAVPVAEWLGKRIFAQIHILGVKRGAT